MSSLLKESCRKVKLLMHLIVSLFHFFKRKSSDIKSNYAQKLHCCNVPFERKDNRLASKVAKC